MGCRCDLEKSKVAFADLMYLVLIGVVDDLLLSLLDDTQHEGLSLFSTEQEIAHSQHLQSIQHINDLKQNTVR